MELTDKITVEGVPEIFLPFDHASVPDLDEKPKPELRHQVEQIERLMLERPQVEIATKHYFAEGLYGREILVPKGVLATGKIHLSEHLVIIPSGDLTVLTDEGVKRIVGPAIFVVRSGMKHIGFAHADTIWICVHACKATDPAAAEQELVVATFDEYRAITEGKEPWLSSPPQL